MEKQNYDHRLGIKMVKAYDRVRPLSGEEKEYLGIRIRYPEKFWKLANYYYNTNKAWIPGKHMEKLEKFLAQQEKRVPFLRRYCIISLTKSHKMWVGNLCKMD